MLIPQIIHATKMNFFECWCLKEINMSEFVLVPTRLWKIITFKTQTTSSKAATIFFLEPPPRHLALGKKAMTLFSHP